MSQIKSSWISDLSNTGVNIPGQDVNIVGDVYVHGKLFINTGEKFLEYDTKKEAWKQVKSMPAIGLKEWLENNIT